MKPRRQGGVGTLRLLISADRVKSFAIDRGAVRIRGGKSMIQNAPNSFPSTITTVSAINGPTSPTIMISR